MPIVSNYWNGVLRRLQAEVEGFNSLIGHQGEKGKENELSLARLLANLMPSRYGVGSGLIFDLDGHSSSQTDIILFDAIDEPAILAQTNQVLFPVENVRCAIEVKTTVGKAELVDIGEKVEKARNLNSQTDSNLIYAAVGYTASVEVETLAKHLRDLNKDNNDQRPNLLLIVDPAMIGMSGLLAGKLGWNGINPDEYLIAVAPLQRRAQNGTVLVGEYDEPQDEYAMKIIRRGNLYTIHSVSEKAYLAESARALLLFCEALLTVLAINDARPAPGFHHYITPEMRDLLQVP